MRFSTYPLVLLTIWLSVCVGQESASIMDLPAVYVRDSGIALEKIALAERMERLREWEKSADVYQEIVDKYADRIIATGSDPQNQIVQYTSVALVVQEKLARWPEEGLTVYRWRYEPSAQELLEQSGQDPMLLQRVLLRYFPTNAARTAGLKLLSTSLENGQFASAAWMGRRLLTYHPSLGEQQPWVLFLTAIAEYLSGNVSSAQTFLQELREKHPEATGVVKGKPVILADALERELSVRVSLVKNFHSADAWPMPFGNPQASAIPSRTSNGGARLFSIELPPFTIRRNNLMYRRQMTQLEEQRRGGGLTGIIPVVDSDELFFQDNARIYAFSLSSGLPLSQWVQTHPDNPKGTFTVPANPLPPGVPLGLTVTERHVISVLGQVSGPWFFYNNLNNQENQSRVVCLDRANGRPIWSVTTRKLKLPAEQSRISDGVFCGMPLVHNNVVYVPVRSNRGGQFEEVSLVALRVDDGSFLWSTYIASAAVGNAVIDAETGMPLSGFVPMLSFSDGRVYVLTNLGAIACLDANDGTTLWLNVYPRVQVLTPRDARRRDRVINARSLVRKPFAQDPPMIVDGKLFVAPSDSDEILICEAVSGAVIRRIPRNLESSRFEPVDMMLAVTDDHLILGNRSTLFSIPWKTFDPNKKLLANGGKYRTFDHPSGSGKSDPVIRGRPFVAADRIYVPIESKLYRMSIRQWRVEDAYPSSGTWDTNEEAPGNVLATPDHVIIAADSRVTVYTDLAVATAKLDQQIQKSPSDPEPYVKYAELLLISGNPRQAIDRLDEAIQRLGKDGSGKLAASELRNRLFEITCGFAIKLQLSDSVTPEIIRQLFSRARAVADLPSQQVRYRLAHASFLRTSNDPAGEIVLYQEILSNPSWRSVIINGRNGDVPAGIEVRTALAELVEKRPEMYASFEEQARSKLASYLAEPSTPPELFVHLAEQYPLSSVAVPALQQAAEQFSKAKKFSLSILTLRELLKRTKDDSIRLKTLESMARTYLQMPGQIELAILRLEQARRIDPSAKLSASLKLNEQEQIQPIALTEAIRILKTHYANHQASLLPVLNLPDGNVQPDKPPLLSVQEYEGVVSLVPQQDKISRPDRLVVYTRDSKVLQFQAGAIQPLDKGIHVAAKPLGCGFYGDRLVIVTPVAVYAVEGGKILWSVAAKDLLSIGTVDREVYTDPNVRKINAPADEGANPQDNAQPPILIDQRLMAANRILRLPPTEDNSTDNPDDKTISYFRLLSDRVILRTSNGRIVSVDLSNGSVQWQVRTLEESLVRHFKATDDFIVIGSFDAGGYSEVKVLDTLNGLNVLSLTFDPQQDSQQLMNLVLSSDGMLVTTTLNELAAHNLYDLDHGSWKRELGKLQGGQIPFVNMTSGDHLQIIDGKIFALTAVGNRPQVIRVFDLYTGESLKIEDPRTGRKMDQVFSVENVGTLNAFPPMLMIKNAGDYLYVIGDRSFKAYQLEGRGSWASDGLVQRGTLADLILARDYAVLIQTPTNPRTTQTVPSFQISAYSRAIVSRGEESGLLTHRVTIKDSSKILIGQWQVTNGSIYYVTTDQKLKLLRSNF
ncbi:MAG: hypothetical protein KatS3mg104_2860 [Phycisphaerae bacterium]|nr:MAG: hypothetical protein KatS3mg104_2860 [Phycisphaerae bacterium]